MSLLNNKGKMMMEEILDQQFPYKSFKTRQDGKGHIRCCIEPDCRGTRLYREPLEAKCVKQNKVCNQRPLHPSHYCSSDLHTESEQCCICHLQRLKSSDLHVRKVIIMELSGHILPISSTPSVSRPSIILKTFNHIWL